MVHHKRTVCRACSTEALRPFLRLGPQPLANSFLKAPEEFAGEASYPLDVYFCQTCSLVCDMLANPCTLRPDIYGEWVDTRTI